MRQGQRNEEPLLSPPTLTSPARSPWSQTSRAGSGPRPAGCWPRAAKVAVNGRDEAKIGAVVDQIRSDGGRAIGVAADVTGFAAIERMRQRVEQELGSVDVLTVFVASGGPPPDRSPRSPRRSGNPP